MRSNRLNQLPHPMRWLVLVAFISLIAFQSGCQASTTNASESDQSADQQQSGKPKETIEPAAAHVSAFVPKRDQHGLMVRCGGSPVRPDNPFRVGRFLLEDPDGFFEHHIQRALRLHAITGNARIVFHMLNGWDDDGMWHSAAVLDAMPSNRRAAFERAVRTLTQHGVTVGTYSSSKVPDRIDSVRIADVGEGELFQYDNPRHRETMMAIFLPLIELGVTEIWLDNSSPSTVRQEFVKLAADLREHGAYFVMEATPLTSTRPRTPDIETVAQIASASWDRRIYLHNDRTGDAWMPLPEFTELIAVISAHQTVDQTVPDRSEAAARRQYLAAQTEKRLRQGFTVFNMQEENDEAFFELISEWK